MLYGEYSIDEFIDVQLYEANFEYDVDYITEYIKNNITNNKDMYKIELNNTNIIFQESKINIEQYYTSRNTYSNIEDTKFEMSYYDEVDSDFPVELIFFGKETNLKLQAKIYFIVDELEKIEGSSYQFIAIIQYKKNK